MSQKTPLHLFATFPSRSSLVYSLLTDRSALLIAIFLFILSLFPLPTLAKYGGGSGDPCDPFLIYDPCHMNQIGLHEEDWGKHFKLMEDIDLSRYKGSDFNIIGYRATSYVRPFKGVFNGNHHSISNFRYSTRDDHFIGLFGVVQDPCSSIHDLTLIDPCILAHTGYHVGSLVGLFNHGTISNCHIIEGFVSGGEYVGGLVGACSFNGSISYCSATGSVSGDIYVGGLIGIVAVECKISSSYATNSVFGINYVGGFVGSNTRSSIISCYATGLVLGDDYIGGLSLLGTRFTLLKVASMGMVI